MKSIFQANYNIIPYFLITFLFIFLTGCELLDLFDTGIRASDPYDSNCNLKPEYHDGQWKKYSDFDYRISPESRSYEAQQYIKASEEIVRKSGQVEMIEAQMELIDAQRRNLQELKKAVREGHTKNLVKVMFRMTYITAESINKGYNAGKSFSDAITDASKKGVQLAGEVISTSLSYAPSDSVVAINTSSIEGKVNDVAREGWTETIKSYGKGADVSKAMLKKAGEHAIKSAMGVPDPKLTPEELGILRKEFLELKRLDTQITIADKKYTDLLWQKRGLEQEIIYLESSLFDLEYNEKDRVDAMLIAECQRKLERESE